MESKTIIEYNKYIIIGLSLIQTQFASLYCNIKLQNCKQHQMLNLTKAPYMDTQILHETREHQHSPLNISVLTKIQNCSVPERRCKDQVLGVFKDQLHESLMEFQMKKMQNYEKKKQFNSSYLQDCQNNSKNLDRKQRERRLYYNSIAQQQNRRYQKFVDDNKVHQSKVNQHINANYDPKVFHHFQETYEKDKIYRQKSVADMLDMQRREHSLNRERQLHQKQNQTIARLNLMHHMSEIEKREKQIRMEEKNTYKKELDRLVQQHPKLRQQKPGYESQMRHNPITNPIDHHIQNVYIARKIAEKYRTTIE